MEYLYHFANASLTLRLIEYLVTNPYLSNSIVTVINQFDGWIVQIMIKSPLHPQQDGDVKAFLSELGDVYSPSKLIKTILAKLAAGQSAVQIMRRHQAAIVSHGSPQCDDIEVFRQNLFRELGYCPQYLV